MVGMAVVNKLARSVKLPPSGFSLFFEGAVSMYGKSSLAWASRLRSLF